MTAIAPYFIVLFSVMSEALLKCFFSSSFEWEFFVLRVLDLRFKTEPLLSITPFAQNDPFHECCCKKYDKSLR